MRTLGRTALCALLIALACTGAAHAAACCAAGTACAITAAPTPDNTLAAAEKNAGWQLLFDGRTFNGWECTDAKNGGWIVDNGAMFYTVKGGGYMYTKESYGDFELKADFMVAQGANSGLFFHWTNLGDPVQTGIEMQVLDSSAKKNEEMDKHDCGAIYDCLAPRENAMKPALEWNSVLLRCSGKYISIVMNGKRIITMDRDKWTEAHKNPDGTPNKFNTAYKDMPRAGHIGLQAHGGKVWFKNVKLRQL